ncbi:protein translocase subunit SecDF [Mycoplasmopsis primatum]|uniref:protein translocase subunit SecDF n=1 Tax=Mycoplasmopsis primatum TaxID=55604 RepID=UPI0004986A6A|nr:membrane protein [Mycoplasmopsis primatum]
MQNFWMNFKNFWKRLFAPSNPKRWLLLSFSIIGIIAAIVCGFVFSITKQTNRSIEYGEGMRYQIEARISKDGKSLNPSNRELIDISNSLKYRFSTKNDFSTSVVAKGNGIIEVSKNELIKDTEKLKEFENSLVKKSNLILTDMNLNPLFTNGQFVKPDPNSKVKIDYNNIEKYITPIKENSAVVRYNPITGKYQLQLELESNAAVLEWKKATEHISKTPGQIMFMWSNLDDLYKLANSPLYKDDWNAANQNAANFTFVNNTPWDDKHKKLNAVKKFQFDGSKYLVNISKVNQSMNNKTFTIQLSTSNRTHAESLASSINFGANKNLSLSIHSQPLFFTKEKSQFNFKYVIIAFVVVISIIAIALMVNYGLLGALSTIPVALYIFLTLQMFTVLRGEYSPSSFVGLTVGIIMGIIPLAVIFNDLKYEIYKGKKRTKKAFKTAWNRNFFNMLDIFIISLILSIISFFLGTPNMQSFSIMVAFSSIFALISMLIINRFITSLFINTDIADNHLKLLAIKTNKINNLTQESKYKKIDYVKKSKFATIAPIILIVAAVITSITLSVIKQNVWNSFNLSGIFAESSFININIEFTKFGIILGVSSIAMIIYSLIRLRWTYTCALILTVIQNTILTFAMFILTRIPLSSFTIQSFLWTLLFTNIISFISFGSIKNKINLYDKDETLSKDQIRNISNSIFYETFRNNVIIYALIVISFGILMSFVKAIDLYTCLAFIVSSSLIMITVFFTGVSLASIFEEKRQAGIKHRIDNKYWVFPNEPAEQIFAGINNYSA